MSGSLVQKNHQRRPDSSTNGVPRKPGEAKWPPAQYASCKGCCPESIFRDLSSRSSLIMWSVSETYFSRLLHFLSFLIYFLTNLENQHEYPSENTSWWLLTSLRMKANLLSTAYVVACIVGLSSCCFSLWEGCTPPLPMTSHVAMQFAWANGSGTSFFTRKR